MQTVHFEQPLSIRQEYTSVCLLGVPVPARLLGTASPATLLTCSTYEHGSEVEWKKELIRQLRTPGKALCVTQISTWELRSSLHYSRWLWLEFTTFSAAETRPNSSWLHFPARRTPPYNAEQHPHVPQLHSDLTGTFIFSSKQGTGTPRRWNSRHPAPTGHKAGWCGDGGPMGQGAPSSQRRQEHPTPDWKRRKNSSTAVEGSAQQC